MTLADMHEVTPVLAAQLEAWRAAGQPVVAARDAATVVLLRAASAGAGTEVYLLRRHSAMAFAAGQFVFPGGGVDPRDFDGAIGWAGPSAAEWADRMGCGEAQARALVCAAVRETFEESGVLLAGATDAEVVSDTTDDGLEADRARLVERSLSFTDFLSQRRLVIRTDLLGYWAHWITPEFEPRRYDTRFFVAAIPVGQLARDVSGEADRVAWMSPAEALAGVDEGAMEMFPPTYVTLREIADLGGPAAVVAAAADRQIETIMPTVEFVLGRPRFVGFGEAGADSDSDPASASASGDGSDSGADSGLGD